MNTVQTPNLDSPFQETFKFFVTKRDGITVEAFNEQKIYRAIAAAMHSVDPQYSQVTIDECYLDVLAALSRMDARQLNIEQIQNTIEVVLMGKVPEVARAFIVYREKHKRLRAAREKFDISAIQSYIHPAKYAKHIHELHRRETYDETCTRNENMHIRKFPQLTGAIKKAFRFVRRKDVLPSMRSFQFGGAAIEANNARLYNCSFTHINRPRVFAESLFLLLAGCGVGYSVQTHHVAQLPKVKAIDTSKVVFHTVEDTIEGWADAFDALVNAAFFTGQYVEFIFNKIRPKNAPLKTSGGKAPGHIPLKIMLEQVRGVLAGAAGRKLRPIECHDILCFAANCVLCGGIRRSSLISLFSKSDIEMMSCKTGDWYKTNPQRSMANNSVVILRDSVSKEDFDAVFKAVKEFGEPGFFFTDSLEYGCNPCAEIGLNPVIVIKPQSGMHEIALTDLGFTKNDNGDMQATGFSFCNLCEINMSTVTTKEDYLARCRAAAFIGTLQASYTSFPYLGRVSEMIAEREALLGVSMTCMAVSPKIAFDPAIQREGAAMVNKTNAEVAKIIGINPGARNTTVKPSGTSTLELGRVECGIHVAPARRCFRRITANESEPVFQWFKKHNPHMCEKKPNGDWCITFPVAVESDTLTTKDVNGIDFLKLVSLTYKNWVRGGTANPNSSPGLTHSVSNTCTVKDEDWDAVQQYLWENMHDFAAVSFLPENGDKLYLYAPYERVITEADELKWNALAAAYVPVDYTQLIETEDTTNLSGEMACVGGVCSI